MGSSAHSHWNEEPATKGAETVAQAKTKKAAKGTTGKKAAVATKTAKGKKPTTKKAVVALPTKAPTAGTTCECGCGKAVFGKRRFAQGHDAKLKSQLAKRAREGDKAALAELKERGWVHLVNVVVKKGAK